MTLARVKHQRSFEIIWKLYHTLLLEGDFVVEANGFDTKRLDCNLVETENPNIMSECVW